MFGGPEPLPADAPFEARDAMERTCKLGEKDLDQALALAGRIDATLPISAATRESFHRIVRL
jgi:3-hydroxyisobutyrate dehydrogenase-like beta-hydroxyacid dehydrogenase